MAIIATVKTMYGEDRELYIRINHAEINNHNVNSEFTFRGYLVEVDYSEAKYIYEHIINMIVDVTGNIWQQAYEKLKEEISPFEDA